MEAEITVGDIIRIFKPWKVCNEDILIQFTDHGVLGICVDPANVMMCKCMAKVDVFSMYVIEEDIDYYIDIERVMECIGNHGIKELVTLCVIGNKLIMDIGRGHYTITLLAQDSCRKYEDIHQLKGYTTEFDISVIEFKKGIKVALSGGEGEKEKYVDIEMSNSEFKIAVMKDTGDSSGYAIEMDEDVGSGMGTYTGSYLSKILSALPQDGMVSIKFGENIPMTVRYVDAGLVLVEFLLSPRIDRDG